MVGNEALRDIMSAAICVNDKKEMEIALKRFTAAFQNKPDKIELVENTLHFLCALYTDKRISNNSKVKEVIRDYIPTMENITEIISQNNALHEKIQSVMGPSWNPPPPPSSSTTTSSSVSLPALSHGINRFTSWIKSSNIVGPRE